MIFLGRIPPRGVRFRVPVAFHHARWLSKLLYVVKIYLFQHQFVPPNTAEKEILSQIQPVCYADLCQSLDYFPEFVQKCSRK